MLHGSDESLATKIYISIAKELSGVSVPTFYLHGEIKFLHNNRAIKTTKTCEKADIIIINKKLDLPAGCEEKAIFSTHYRTYLKNENIVGSFFWQKGRPNIIFRRAYLEENKIRLSQSFQKYID